MDLLVVNLIVAHGHCSGERVHIFEVQLCFDSCSARLFGFLWISTRRGVSSSGQDFFGKKMDKGLCDDMDKSLA